MINKSGINSHLYKNNKLALLRKLNIKKKAEYTAFFEKTDAEAVNIIIIEKMDPKKSIIFISKILMKAGLKPAAFGL